jgi:hypothetical protein
LNAERAAAEGSRSITSVERRHEAMSKLRLIVALTLVVMAMACATSKEPKQQGSNAKQETKKTEVTATPSANDEVTLKIIKVELTQKSQTFLTTGIDMKFKLVRTSPQKGSVYVIVTFSVDYSSDKLSYDFAKDLMLSDSEVCGTGVSGIWYPCDEPKKGSIQRRIYEILSSQVRTAKIHFRENDYPIEPFLDKRAGA